MVNIQVFSFQQNDNDENISLYWRFLNVKRFVKWKHATLGDHTVRFWSRTINVNIFDLLHNILKYMLHTLHDYWIICSTVMHQAYRVLNQPVNCKQTGTLSP